MEQPFSSTRGGVVKTVSLNNSTPADLGEFIEIANITTEEEVQEVAISVDSDGQPFEAEEFILICSPHSSTTNTTEGVANLGYTFVENGVTTKKERLHGVTGKANGATKYIYCGTKGTNEQAYFALSSYVKRLSKDTMMVVNSCKTTSGDVSVETRDKYMGVISGQDPSFEIVKCYGKITEIKIQNHWNSLNIGVGTRIILLIKK